MPLVGNETEIDKAQRRRRRRRGMRKKMDRIDSEQRLNRLNTGHGR